MDRYGYLKTAAAIPSVRVADCAYNGERIAALCGTIGFAVIGAALLAVVAVRFVREWKEEAQRELERQAEEAEKTEEATDE